MIVAIPKESDPGETLVAAIPATVKDLVKLGMTVRVQVGAGGSAFFSDENYAAAGAKLISGVSSLFKDADLILKVAPASLDEIQLMPDACTYVSQIQTTSNLDLVENLTEKKITAFSLNLIPRTTLAQSMDALSSQSNIAGYKAVLIGSAHLPVYMPLLMTAAGTIPPAKVLILGAGVAGLQAIATAKRLGAQVEVFDVRPVVKEQVESLGAKFIEVGSESDEGVGAGGYAKETTADYKQRQQDLIKKHISKSDMVITTALIPGRPAPILITKDMAAGMKSGSVIMDLAAENGGNCELTQPGRVIEENGVIIDGSLNLPATMPKHASQVYAKNIITFINYLYPEGKINLNLEDEIISGALFTLKGEVTHEQTKKLINNQ